MLLFGFWCFECQVCLLYLEQFDRSVSERLGQIPSPFLENLKDLPTHRCSSVQAALASAVSNFVSAIVSEVA